MKLQYLNLFVKFESLYGELRNYNCYPSYGHVTALLSSIFQIRQHHELNNTIFGRFVEREVSALGWAAW
ncbi:hypothetical protein T02_8738 [Trichinella nativa]|uniref:Uncharacterized protein n=1 Tax=Trichinella nativa TaxID=6335 RepID=A0A0V1KX19_9BILA|nr:hypothetical protein T02_8738 [Trichinella nativa]